MLTLVACTQAASTAADTANIYICTVAEKAGIASNHLENGPPPSAFLGTELATRFKIKIVSENDNSLLMEIPYDGPDYDVVDYGSPSSVLHDTYRGDGREFKSEDDQSFFSLFETIHSNEDGDLAFYHAGWEYPGGEDTTLAVRWGRCKLITE